MKTTLINKLAWIPSLLLAALSADLTLAQSRFAPYSGRWDKSGASDGSGQTSAVVVSGPSLRITKTAFVEGHEVCGVIRISNTGGLAANITGIADTLEVHFPRGVTPPSLPAGSTSTWFKVADVPIPLPGPIAPGATVSIDYCFPLCETADYAGANSMRNVIAVSLTNASGVERVFTTRSVSFPPPLLDCQACCKPNGDCADAVPDSCTNDGGLPQGVDTDCASTQCCDPLGADCSASSDCCDEDATCFDDTCCLRLAETGCTDRSHCCEESGSVVLCEEGKCCAPNRAQDSCHDAEDCCDANATCSGGTCCIALGDTGCTNLVGNDCCRTFGAVTCEAGKCCAPTGAEDSCFVDADCCDPGATCNGGTCCVRLAESECEEASDCCEVDGAVICDAGRCCAPSRAPDSCHDATDCCDANAICSSGTCCIALGDTGCTNLVGNDCCQSFGAVTCEAGKCCAPTGASDSCFIDTDCCDPNATCNGGTCCVRLGASVCEDNSDCCDEGNGVVTCDGGKCCAPSGSFSSCSADADCCIESETCNTLGVCCVAIGNIGCDTPGAHCCDYPGSTLICNDAGRCCGPTGIASACSADSDCCDSNATCNGGTCCVQLGSSGCETVSDCCDDFDVTCNAAGKCCVPNGIHDSCSVASDCCNENAVCDIFHGCCIATGTTGCFGASDCCDGGAICPSGKCCIANGAGSCRDSTDCCDGNAICNLSSTCCVPDLRPCDQSSDCCSGLCTGGACEGVIGP